MEGPFEFDNADIEIDDSENGDNSHPNILTVDDTIRKRDRGLRGKASGSAENALASRFQVAHNLSGYTS